MIDIELFSFIFRVIRIFPILFLLFLLKINAESKKHINRNSFLLLPTRG